MSRKKSSWGRGKPPWCGQRMVHPLDRIEGLFRRYNVDARRLQSFIEEYATTTFELTTQGTTAYLAPTYQRGVVGVTTKVLKMEAPQLVEAMHELGYKKFAINYESSASPGRMRISLKA